jgi:3-phenylpropionate/trans-cinnamate dioxygenase ferredoxin subunit
VPEGGVKVVRIEDQAIAVFLIGGKYYALDDVCTHDGGPLAEGAIEGTEIECPRTARGSTSRPARCCACPRRRPSRRIPCASWATRSR